jgi:hypothetical protein
MQGSGHMTRAATATLAGTAQRAWNDTAFAGDCQPGEGSVGIHQSSHWKNAEWTRASPSRQADRRRRRPLVEPAPARDRGNQRAGLNRVRPVLLDRAPSQSGLGQARISGGTKSCRKQGCRAHPVGKDFKRTICGREVWEVWVDEGGTVRCPPCVPHVKGGGGGSMSKCTQGSGAPKREACYPSSGKPS